MLTDLLGPYRGTLVSLATKELMKLLVSKASFFAYGPVGWIAAKILSFFISWALDKGIKEADTTWSRMEKEQLAENISKLISSYDSASAEEKETIEDKIIDESRELIKLLKSRPIT
jgi:hypothetical protein